MSDAISDHGTSPKILKRPDANIRQEREEEEEEEEV
jgi:hypothetical protein